MDEEADIGSGHVGEEEENKEEEKEEKGMEEGSREVFMDKPYKNTTDVDCLKPAILQFPRTPWNKEERQSGWVRFFSILLFLNREAKQIGMAAFSCQVIMRVDQWVRFLDFHHLSACLDISACSEGTVEIFLSAR